MDELESRQSTRIQKMKIDELRGLPMVKRHFAEIYQEALNIAMLQGQGVKSASLREINRKTAVEEIKVKPQIVESLKIGGEPGKFGLKMTPIPSLGSASSPQN